MSGIWILAVVALAGGASLAAAAARSLRVDAAALAAEASAMAGLRADARALAAEVEALRSRVAACDARRSDG